MGVYILATGCGTREKNLGSSHVEAFPRTGGLPKAHNGNENVEQNRFWEACAFRPVTALQS